MPIPVYHAFYRPLLEFAADRHDHSLNDAVEYLAVKFGVTGEEREVLIPSGGQRLLNNRAGWGRTYLAKAGLLEYPKRGMFRITDRGVKALASGAAIDNKYLRQFPEFAEFMSPKTSGEGEVAEAGHDTSSASDGETAEATPEELIDRGYQQLHLALASEILERVRGCSPTFFERLVVELLVAMGYGGSLVDAGKAIGKSGDNGIDGIIKEDKLGLDVIYIQAKRWEATVGRPEIQQFAGALQGQRARKGVFLTTSSFSAEARQYASLIDTRIVLIDGKELARLMITHGVGVSTAATYEVKKIDFDYFVEDGA